MKRNIRTDMKLQADNDFGEWITIAGNRFYPAYIIKGKERHLMIDAGINLMGPAYSLHWERSSEIKMLWTMFLLRIPISTTSVRFPISREKYLILRRARPGGSEL